MATLETFISKFEELSPIEYAKALFKENADVGTAIVSVLSNTGIAGFKFHVGKTEQVKMESEITDHYIDDNSAVQDHIILKPVIITLRGLQGEYFYSVNKIEDTLALVVPTMKLCKQFLPKLSAATVQTKLAWKKNQTDLQGLAANYAVYDKAVPLSQKLSQTWNNLNGVDLFKLFQEIYKLKSAQTRAFLYFQALWKSQELFTVETTWRRYSNMVIQNLIPLRDENADITDFTITFKQIRKTQSLVTNLNDKAGRRKNQEAAVTDKGLDQGLKTETIK